MLSVRPAYIRSVVMSSMTGTKAIQHLAPNKRVRSCRLPSIFTATQILPCTASAKNDVAPTGLHMKAD